MAPGLITVEDEWKVHAASKAGALFPGHKELEGEEVDELSRTWRYEADSEILSRPSQTHRLLRASPYTEHEHLLDLTTLIQPLQFFAKALTDMRAIRPDYARAPYDQAFNWDSVVDGLSHTTNAQLEAGQLPESIDFFVVVFRSRINEHADRRLLGELDKAAHVEAVRGGGLLKYWFGTPDAEGRNLATCVWRDRQDARRGGAGPDHALAMQAARRMYSEWFVERLQLTVRPRDGSWGFSERSEDWVADG